MNNQPTPDTPSPAWLVKQEPEEYSWGQFCSEGSTLWTGVRNFQARNHLLAMKPGDKVLFYHSGKERQIVGLAQVTGPARPDHTAPPDESWVCVELQALRALTKPVPLAAIKKHPALASLPLVRQPRLSVMPVKPPELQAIFELAGECLTSSACA